METIEEYIARLNPSMKYVRLHYRKLDVFIDSTDRRLVDNLKIPHELSGTSKSNMVKKMSKPTMSIGSYLYSDDEEYGLGRVHTFFSSDESLMLVQFKERKLPTMCSRTNMTTSHDDVVRKLKLIY